MASRAQKAKLNMIKSS